jgi:purine catabolism regulator
MEGNYTLGDLLSEPSLGLELLTGGDEALSVPVAGAHAIEMENPAKWLDSHWMMLTMGVRLRNKPQLQRQLIAELQGLGASCLGFGVGLTFKCVPPALLDEARRRNFPVILVPEDAQFRDIARAVFQSTVGIEPASFRRLSSIQQNLLRAFAEPDPLEAIVRRLARLVNSTVAIVSLDGDVDAATGALPLPEILEQVRAEAFGPITQFDAAGWRVLAAPVTSAAGSSSPWLLVASRGATVTRELAYAAVQVTTPLLSALAQLNVTNRKQDRAIRQALLESLLVERLQPVDVRSMEARLTALGMDFAGCYRTVVLREGFTSFAAQHEARVTPEELAAWLHERLEALGCSYLLTPRDGEVVVLASSDLAIEALWSEGVERWPTLTVGVGRPVVSVSDIEVSYRDGQIVVRHLGMQSEHSVMVFDDLDLITQVMAEIPAERFTAKAAPLSALLRDNPIQLEGLRAFFANGRDIKAAAESIFVHPNTLRYRLERLEQSLGRSLRDPAVTASLYCVLTLMSEIPSTPSTVTAAIEQPRDVGAPAGEVCEPKSPDVTRIYVPAATDRLRVS